MDQKRQKILQNEILRIDGVLPTAGIEKHKKMASSPFVFFRGSAQLFYADIANASLCLPEALLDAPLSTVMGDCHTSNFGFLTEEGSHGDNVIFCPNDFDDACIGYAGWDLLRYITSLYLCFQHCQLQQNQFAPLRLASAKALKKAVKGFFEGYLTVCQSGIDGHSHFDSTVDTFNDSSLMKKAFKKAQRRAAGGSDFTLKSALAKAVNMDAQPLTFVDNAEKFKRIDNRRYRALFNAFSPYMDDAVLDIVERLGAGTGSVNMQRYYFLVGPQQSTSEKDLALCHVVEVKQQRQAAPIHYFPELSPVNRLPPAHLTQVCQKRMQRRPDLVLDEAIWQRKHWLVRSRHHARVGFDPEDIALGKAGKVDDGFIDYATHCGQALALAHCRGDRRSTLFEQSMLSALPQSSSALIEQAEAYAQQVNKDCDWLKQQIFA